MAVTTTKKPPGQTNPEGYFLFLQYLFHISMTIRVGGLHNIQTGLKSLYLITFQGENKRVPTLQLQ